MWKRFVADYFSFTKRDRTGILTLISLILIFLLLPYCYPYFIKQKTYDHSEFEKAIASLKVKAADSSDHFTRQHFNKSSDEHNYPKPYAESARQFNGELFYFDPNTASVADWKRLGLRDKTIATIQNYLSKGGKFYKKDDLAKIWGLHENEVQRLTPYVQIAAAAKANEPTEKKIFEKKDYKKNTYTISAVDINNADSTAFIALPGIGSKLSDRIIRFRDKLGGFYKVEQIGETFGLPDSTFQKIKSYLKIDNAVVKQININTASVDEMKSHPYLRYALANAIIQYRAQHGNFKSVADIKKLVQVTPEIFDKLAPYLTVETAGGAK